MVSVGLIGYGYWGKIIHSKLELIADIKFVCRSKDTYLDKLEPVDWVFIVTPDKTHYEITKTCLNHGKNVFCEKPFTDSYNDAMNLYNIAEKNKLKLYVDDVFNYRDEINELHNIINKDDEIKVIWNTTKSENYLNRLTWHDLYMLYPIFKKDLDIKWPRINNVMFNYEVGEKKYHEVAGIDFTDKPTSNDALLKMLDGILNQQTKVDFDYNKATTLRCQSILDEVKNV